MFKNRTVKSFIFIGLVCVTQQLFWLIGLGIFVVLPLLITGNACGNNPNTEICAIISSPSYNFFLMTFSLMGGIFLTYWIMFCSGISGLFRKSSSIPLSE